MPRTGQNGRDLMQVESNFIGESVGEGFERIKAPENMNQRCMNGARLASAAAAATVPQRLKLSWLATHSSVLRLRPAALVHGQRFRAGTVIVLSSRSARSAGNDSPDQSFWEVHGAGGSVQNGSLGGNARGSRPTLHR